MRASMRENMRTGRKDATLIRVEFHVTVTKIGMLSNFIVREAKFIYRVGFETRTGPIRYPI
jgi:N12 class adenine-specific DNA methylase